MSTTSTDHPGQTTGGGKALIAGGISALLASACCLGPLVLIMLGISGAWIGSLTLLEPYQPWFMGAAAIAYLSALVNQRYTATQYALFSSLVTLPGRLIGGLSGFMVTGMGYGGFFIFSTLAAIPALLLFYWLKPRVKLADSAN